MSIQTKIILVGNAKGKGALFFYSCRAIFHGNRSEILEEL